VLWFRSSDTIPNKKLSWCWQTQATRLEVSQGHISNTTLYARYFFLLVWNSNALRCAVFSDIRLQKWRELEIQVRGHSRSLKMVPFYRLGMVSVSYRNFVPKTHLTSKPWPWKPGWVRGPSRSLEISPFDKAYMTSYWRYIVKWLSRVVSEIFNVEIRDIEINVEIRVRGHWRSFKVMPFDGFLL